MAHLSSAFNGLNEQMHVADEPGCSAMHGERRGVSKAMLLAAGRGRRMGPLTAAGPKPLLEVGGEALIVRQIRRLAAAGVRELVVNLSYRGHAIRAALGDGARWGVAIEYSDEGPVALETGGGILAALPLLGPAPFLVVNADIYTDFDFAGLALTRGRAELVLVPNPPEHAAGDFALAPDGRVGGAGPMLTFAGISVLDPALFTGLRAGPRPLRPILDAAIAAGDVFGRLHRGAWFDVGTAERLRAAREYAAGRSGHADRGRAP